MSKMSDINYRDYPECMFAMIAAFLPAEEGDDLRRAAGSVVFQSVDSEGKTYQNGLLHSFSDNPAVNEGVKLKAWYKNGIRHRDGDLPAVIRGKKHIWYKDGVIHRDGDNPAIINENLREWYKNGVNHRDGDLPAVIIGDLGESPVNREEGEGGDSVEEGDRVEGVDSVEEGDRVEEELLPLVQLKYQVWYKNGRIHREGDLPAIINCDRHEWWKNNKKHREGGPAVIDPLVGIEEWWSHGELLEE